MIVYPEIDVSKKAVGTKSIGSKKWERSRESWKLANMAVEETHMGRVDSKIAKCKNKSKSTWWRMRDKKSRGVIEIDKENGIIKYAKPIGGVGAVTPTTNPVINPMQNSMCALKAANTMNVSRISYRVPEMYIPSDEEIWAS